MKQTAFYLFLGTLIFAPLAFGTVEIWSYLIMELLVCTSAILLFISVGKKKYYQVPGLRPLALVNAFILLQLIPLPGSIVNLLSPNTYAIYQNAALIAGDNIWMPLSIYPRATFMELLRFSTYVLFYVVSVQFLTDRKYLKTTVAVVTWLAALLALLGIVEFITENLDYPLPHNKLFWLRDLTQGGTPRGPYVNRNHYAGFLEMIFPLALAMFLSYRPQIRRLSVRKQIVDFFTGKQVHQHFFYGTAAILIATGILLSLSRGGILSLSISMIFFAGILIFRAKQKKAGFFISLIVAVVLVLTGSSGWDAIFKRFESLHAQTGLLYDSRLIIWQDVVNVIREFPLTGTGAGTLEKIYPAFRTFPGDDILEHAHNDYLEFFATGGIVLTALMGWCLLAVLYSAISSFIRRREPFSVLLFTGSLTATCAILIHSIVDFNMQVGANDLYFFLVMALAVTAGNTRMRPGLNPTYLNQKKFPPLLITSATLLLFITVIYSHGGALLADQIISRHQHTALRPDMSGDKLRSIHHAAKTAAIFDAFNPKYTNIAANTANLLLNDPEALNFHSRSLRLDPQNSRYMVDAAFFLHGSGNPALAEILFREGITYDPTSMAAYIKYAAILLKSHETEKGISILKQAMSMDPRITETCLALMVLHNFDDDQMQTALPDLVMPYLIYGDFLNASGKKQEAENAYLTALAFLPDSGQIEKKYFLHVVNFFRRNHMDEKALEIILRAVRYFPNDPGLRRIASDLYRNLGIDYRAEEEYRKAEMLKSVLP